MARKRKQRGNRRKRLYKRHVRRRALRWLRRTNGKPSPAGRWLRRLRRVRELQRAELVELARSDGELWELDGLDAGPPAPELSGPVRPEPHGPDRYLDPLYPTEGLDPFVAELRDARLTGPIPLALTPSGRIVKQTLIAPDADDGRVDRALQEGVREQGIGPTLRGLRRRPPEPTLRLDCATVLSGRSNAYFHFVCDQLPKLRGIERYAELTGRMPTLVLPRNLTRWQHQLLGLAGHGESDSIEWPGGDAVVGRLVVPSHPETTPGTVGWLRERLWTGAESALGPEGRAEPGARILISRRDARRTRYLEDEERLAGALADRGFRLLVLSEIGQAETIDLFRRAEIVVGLHGSGLTNVVYCENASVLEVFGSSVRPYFFRLAHAAGLPYRYELADESDGEVRIDADRMVNVIEDMLSERQET